MKMATLAESKAKLLQLVNDDAKLLELYRRIEELSRKLDDTRAKLDAVEKKKTEFLTDS